MFEVVDLAATPGWVMVGDTGVAETPAEAVMKAEHREIAQEMADRLNVRALTGRS